MGLKKFSHISIQAITDRLVFLEYQLFAKNNQFNKHPVAKAEYYSYVIGQVFSFHERSFV